jgi:predicted Zn-dependent protease
VSKRLAFLEKMTREGSKDPMAWYGLAMEYRTLARMEEALLAFTSLRQTSPEYVAAYLMCGTMLSGMGRKDDAKEWLEAGIAAAQKKGDAHAKSELEEALAALGPA